MVIATLSESARLWRTRHWRVIVGGSGLAWGMARWHIMRKVGRFMVDGLSADAADEGEAAKARAGGPYSIFARKVKAELWIAVIH